MRVSNKLLGQARAAGTDPVSVYSPEQPVIIRSYSIVNVGGVDALVRVFMDNDGATYDESTAILPGWDVLIEAASSVLVEGWFPMDNRNGNFAYRSSVGDALTLTVWGQVVLRPYNEP
jgi:hypothetical protein